MSGTSKAEFRTPHDVKRELRRRVRSQRGYDAFISYAHDPDAHLAQQLERRLEAWARPWYGGRAMRVFRDTSKGQASTGLRTAIRDALDQTRWLIVILSEGACRSEWVGEEVAHWRDTQGSERILLVHAGGRLSWDEASADFSADTDCVPDELRGAFAEQPRFVDLTGLAGQRRNVRRERMHVAIRDLATSIHNMPPDLLEGAHRSSVRMVRIGSGAAAALLLAASVLGALAMERSRQAEREAARADEESAVASANAAAAQALDLYVADLDIGLLLAVEAWNHRDTPETRAALFSGLVAHPHLEQVIRSAESPWRVALSPDETKLGIFSLDQRLTVWDLDERVAIADAFVPDMVDMDAMVFDYPGTRIALAGHDLLEVRSLAALDRVEISAATAGTPHSLAFAGSQVLVGHQEGVDAVDTATGSMIRIVDGPIQAIAVDAAGVSLALATDELVQVWDLSVSPPRGLQEAQLEERVQAVGISPDGNVITFATRSAVGIWDTEAGFLTSSFQVIPNVSSVVAAEAGPDVAAARSDGRVTLWSVIASDLPTVDVGGSNASLPPATGTRGRRVATVGENLVRVSRLDQPFALARGLAFPNALAWNGEPLLRHISFSPAGDRMLVVEPGGLSIRETGGWGVVSSLEDEICTAQFTGDGSSIVVVVGPGAEGGASIQVRSATELDRVLSKVPISLDECHLGIDVGADGSRYAVDSKIFDAATGLEIASGGDASCVDNALSGDARRLMWSSAGTEAMGPVVRLLDVDTGDVVEHPTGQAAWGVAFGPSGMMAAGLTEGQESGGVTIWSDGFARTAALPANKVGVGEYEGKDHIMALAFDPTGKKLATGGLLGSLTVWDLDPDTALGLACDIANRRLSQSDLAGRFSAETLGFEAQNVCEGRPPSHLSGKLGPFEIRPVADRAATTTVPASTSLPSTTTTVAADLPRFGDLEIGTPMSVPACDGSYVLLLGAAADPAEYRSTIEALLAAYPGSGYLRTDVAGCSSLRQHIAGNPIYAVFYGPFASLADALAFCPRGPVDAYLKRLDNVTDPATTIACR